MKHSSVKNRSLYDQMVMPGIHPDGEVNVPSIREALAMFKASGDVTGLHRLWRGRGPVSNEEREG